MICRSPLPSRRVAKPSLPRLRLSMTRPTTDTRPSGRGVWWQVACLATHLAQRVGARIGHGIGLEPCCRDPIQLARRTRICSGSRSADSASATRSGSGGIRADDGRCVLRAGSTERLVLGVCVPAQHRQGRLGQETLGTAGGRADTGEVRGVLEAHVARLPGRLVLRVGAVRATRAASCDWRAAGLAATAATPGRRRSGHRARRPRGTSRSSARHGPTPKVAERSRPAPSTISSIRPLSAVGSRRIRSSDSPLRPHGHEAQEPAQIAVLRRRPGPSCSGRREGPRADRGPSRIRARRRRHRATG